MANEQSTRTGMLKTSTWILIGCAAVLALVCSSHILTYYFAREANHNDPLLTLTPQPLKDYRASSQGGMSFSQFGYAFEVPWRDLDKVDNRKSVTRIYFKGGQVVLFFDPKQTVNRLKVMQDAAAQNGKDLRVLFGSEVPTSNYQVLSAILSTTPYRVSLLTPTNTLVRISILLTFKHTELINQPTSVYSVETHNLRGFQKGDPLRAERATILDLFNEQDQDLELWVATQKGSSAIITQADINRIVQSLHPTSELN
jgi:hypothetical protein